MVGREEIDVIAPAVKRLRRRGLRAGHDGRQKMPVVRTPVKKTPS